MSRREAESGWNVAAALAALRARLDPYIWSQGEELFRRGAVEDFAVTADGSIEVKVLDPRDARRFFVKLRREHGGRVASRCPCPYRFEGHCRHEVVALKYLSSVAGGEPAGEGAAGGEAAGEPAAAGPRAAAGTAGPGTKGAAAGGAAAGTEARAAGSVIYRFRGEGAAVRTCEDGSLLRVALHSLGSSRAPHRVALQLFTGTGWTEVRTPDVERWIAREPLGPHPRDVLLGTLLAGDGAVRREVDSETLAAVLRASEGSGALVDRGGRALPVSPWPWRLAGRLVRARADGAAGAESPSAESTGAGTAGAQSPSSAASHPVTIGVALACRSLEGEVRPFEDVSIVPSVSPWIQLEDGTFHPLAAFAPGPYLEELQLEDLAAIPPAELDRFLAEGIARLEALTGSPLESEPDLIREVEGVDGARLRLEGAPDRLAGRLELSYGGEWAPAPDSPEPWTVSRAGAVHRYPPAGQSLARARRELEALGARRAGEEWVLEGRGVLARLLGTGGGFVRIELPERLEALDLVGREPVLSLEVGARGFAPGAAGADEGGREAGGGPAFAAPGAPRRSATGIAWLEVSWHLADGGRELSVDLEALADAAHRGERLVELADGTVLGLEHAPVRALLDLALEARRLAGGRPGAAGAAAPAGRLRLPVFAAAELMAERPGVRTELAPEVRRLVEALAAPERETAALSLQAEVAAVLRPYQRVAVSWFERLAAHGLGGVLADEMGLGKTLMMLAHFFGREEDALAPGPPVLVVCPTSLGFNWLEECRRFFPRVRAVSLTGLSPAARRDEIEKGAELLITSYALLRRDREHLEAREIRAVVLDEAQHIKNAESQTAQAVFALPAPERWALTGTPVENHLGELWSLFHFALPGLLGTAKEFQEDHAEPIARREEGAAEGLRRRVRPFLLRRTKAQVLPDLPPRIVQTERVPMTEPQRRLYEEHLLRARSELEGADPGRGRFQVLAALTRLRQICCHPALVSGPAAGAAAVGGGAEDEREAAAGGAKFELLAELLAECREEGHRVLLFSQWTSMLDLIEERLEAEGVRRSRLDGATRDREGAVRSFAEDASVPVFLISLKAGGFGLNLTQADTVILYDPWWNPAAEEQAAARAHRIGQTVPVHVHKLITAGTVEEKIVALQEAKKDLAGSIVRSEDEALEAFTTEELRALIFE